MKTFEEHRKHKRFRVKNRSTVLISPITVLSYAVLDISESGLAFSYAGWEKWPTKGIKLDIIDQEFFLEDIKISVIEDVKIDNESNKLRRCCIKFIGLEATQKALLRQYIASVAAN
jgi:c-di-GMP-binding flagellar brake protein YcgR